MATIGAKSLDCPSEEIRTKGQAEAWQHVWIELCVVEVRILAEAYYEDGLGYAPLSRPPSVQHQPQDPVVDPKLL